MPSRKPHGEVIVQSDAKALTPDLASRIFFGMPLDELVKDIQGNPGGKYNDLFAEPAGPSR